MTDQNLGIKLGSVMVRMNEMSLTLSGTTAIALFIGMLLLTKIANG